MLNLKGLEPLVIATATLLSWTMTLSTVAANQVAQSPAAKPWWQALLADEAVRKEIALSDEGYKTLQELEALPPAQATEKLGSTLEMPAHSRLIQIRYQVLGPKAVLLGEVAKELRIDQSQRERLAEAERANQADHEELLDSLMRIRFVSQEKMDEFVFEYIERTDHRVLQELTEKQREKLTEMQGESFKEARRLRISFAASAAPKG